MFEPNARQIIYRSAQPDRGTVQIDIHLNAQGLLDDLPATGPAWTRCEGAACGDCGSDGAHCLAALAIVPVVERCGELTSLDVVTAEAISNERHCQVAGPAARPLASIMGLLMAASGCSRLSAFRTMAQFHQPFATAEETVVRAAGFWLLQSWAAGTLAAADPFAPLREAWEGLEDVNRQVGRQLQLHCHTDAAPNGLAYLDALAKLGLFGLDEVLAALRPGLLATRVPGAAGT